MTVPTVPGGFYDTLTGIHADDAVRDRVYNMRRRTKLNLVREPDNEYDSNAIAVFDSKNMRLGYLPRTTAEWLAPKMDSGEAWSAKVAKVLGTAPRYAVMVMFVHLPDTELPDTDAWYSQLDGETPLFYRTVGKSRSGDDYDEDYADDDYDDESSPGVSSFMWKLNITIGIFILLVVCAIWQWLSSVIG